MKLLHHILIFCGCSLMAQENNEQWLVLSENACDCIAQIELKNENKNQDVKKCILTVAGFDTELGEERSQEEAQLLKRIEAHLVRNCEPLKQLTFSENSKFQHSYSENVLAQLAYDDGMEYLKEGDVAYAIEKFSKAVEIDENFAFAWDNLGISYRKNKEYDKAIEAYNRSLQIYDKGRLPLLNIAITYNLNEQYAQAIEHYKKFIAVYEDDPEGYYGLGLILYTQEKKEEGLENLIHAYTIYTAQDSPYREDAARKIGYMYKDLKNNDQLELFHKVAERYNLRIESN